MSIEVRYIDAPPGAQKNMSVTATEANALSSVGRIAVATQGTAYATLEPYGWPLDGSRSIMPDNPAESFWSQNVSTDGILDPVPTITLTFAEKYSATGITFTFSPETEEWCSKMHVRWYNGADLISVETAYPDASMWTLEKVVEGFDRIEIDLVQTNIPGHFAKVRMIEVGRTILFTREELKKVHLVNEIDPTLSDLTIDTLSVDIQDRSGRALLPQENQRMDLYRNGVLVATQYITGSTRQERNLYSITCQSVIGQLEDTYLGGIYSNAPVNQVVAEIVDGRDYEVDELFAGDVISGYLPVCTRREALQQLAFAIGAVVTTQGTDAICLKKLPQETQGVFSKKDIFYGGSTETNPRYYKVEVLAHSYVASNEEEVLVDNEYLTGQILLTFDNPHHSYVITGGQLIEEGANWVAISCGGYITLTGKEYTHSTARHSLLNSAATAAERHNIQTVENATLVHSGNVNKVLRRLFDISKYRQTLSQEVVVTSQCAGQRVTSEDPFGTQIRGYIASMESDFTQTGHTAAITILGVEVKTEYATFYAGDLIAGDMEGLPV
jgi:hypothetical protein